MSVSAADQRTCRVEKTELFSEVKRILQHAKQGKLKQNQPLEYMPNNNCLSNVAERSDNLQLVTQPLS